MWIAAILMLLFQLVTAHAGSLEDCFEQVQDIDRRIHGCTDRIRQFPKDATAFFNRGAAYLSKGDLDRAIADYATVIQIDPAYSPAYYHRGIAYGGRAQYDQAIADFSKAVEINPGYGGAFDARARIHLMIDQRVLALRDAERAVSIDPFDAEFRDTRARAYEATGRIEEAIADYRRVLSSNPSAKSAVDSLSRLGVSLSTPKAPAGAASALNAPANAARKAKRSAANLHHYVPQPRHSREENAAQPRTYSREEIECERAKHEDASGQNAGYPCWAREAFSRNRIRGR